MCVLENDTEFVTCIRGIVFLEQSVDFVCFGAKEADDAEKVNCTVVFRGNILCGLTSQGISG